MEREFLKEKINKYSKKISLLKGGSIGKYSPAFFNDDQHNVFKFLTINKIISFINNPPNLMDVPLFLLSSLFLNLNENALLFSGFIDMLDPYEKIVICDYSNFVNDTANHTDFFSGRDRTKRNTLDIYNNGILRIENLANNNPNKLYICCCQHLRDKNIERYIANNKISIDSLNEFPLTLNNVIFVDVGIIEIAEMTNYTEKNINSGAYDDFVFWLLSIAVFNLYDNSYINSSLGIRDRFNTKLELLTNDKQKWFDLNKNEIGLGVPLGSTDPITKPFIKNLHLELKDTEYNYFNIFYLNGKQHIKQYTSWDFNDKMCEFLNGLIYFMDVSEPINNNIFAFMNGITPLPSINWRGRKINGNNLFESGILLAQYCIDRNLDYNDLSFNDYKLMLQTIDNCTNFFDIMISYIKFIQNIITRSCNTFDSSRC